jgi:hypothetical protein
MIHTISNILHSCRRLGLTHVQASTKNRSVFVSAVIVDVDLKHLIFLHPSPRTDYDQYIYYLRRDRCEWYEPYCSSLGHLLLGEP